MKQMTLKNISAASFAQSSPDWACTQLGILVQLADMVQGGGDTADWAAAVVHDVGEDAGVAEDEAGRGHLGWVAALAPGWEGKEGVVCCT